MTVSAEHKGERSDDIGEPSEVSAEDKGERYKSADATDGGTAVLGGLMEFCTKSKVTQLETEKETEEFWKIDMQRSSIND